MIPYLPTELLRAILSNLSSPSDLARCCSISKTFLSIAQPLLYNELEFEISGNYPFDRGSHHMPQIFIEPMSLVLLATFRRTAHLRQLVRKVTLLGVMGALVDSTECRARRVDLEELLKEIVGSFSSATLLTLDNVPLLGHLDGAVQLLQSRRSDGGTHPATVPAFSIVELGSLEVAMIRGAYQRFLWSPFAMSGDQIRVEELLQRSQHTLQKLGIPLEASTSLALFQNLERLSLRLFVQTPSILQSHLSSVLFDLPSLRILLLHGSAR